MEMGRKEIGRGHLAPSRFIHSIRQLVSECLPCAKTRCRHRRKKGEQMDTLSAFMGLIVQMDKKRKPADE